MESLMAFAIVFCLIDLASGGERYKWAINGFGFSLMIEQFCDVIC